MTVSVLARILEFLASLVNEQSKFRHVLAAFTGLTLIWALNVETAIARTLWSSNYNGPGNFVDQSRAIAVDTLGSVYVTGESQGSGTFEDYCTIKYRPSGDTAWVRRFNGADTCDFARSVAVDEQGNVYVTGYSATSGAVYRWVTIKYDSTGQQLWLKDFTAPGGNTALAAKVALDDAGNAYVAGSTSGIGTSLDYTLIKYTSTGDTLWTRRYDGPGSLRDSLMALFVDSAGNAYVTGYSYSLAQATQEDFATIRYRPNGDTAWVRRYDGPGHSYDWGTCVTVDMNGNVCVAGNSIGSPIFQWEWAVVKYDSTGNELWVGRDLGEGFAYDIASDKLGNIVVAGTSIDVDPEWDIATIKYYPNGDTAWQRRFDGIANSTDIAFAADMDSLGNVYVTGKTLLNDPFQWRSGTIKYDPDGEFQWMQLYRPTQGGAEGWASLVDRSFVYTTGPGSTPSTYWDFSTVKYDEHFQLGTAGERNRLSFSYQIGGAAPPPETLIVLSNDESRIQWDMNSSVPWLSTSRSSGVSSDTIVITISDLALLSGVYQGQLAISAPYADNSPLVIDISYHVEPSVEVTNQLTPPGTIDSLGIYISHDTLSGFFIPLTYAESDSLLKNRMPSGLRVDSLRINPYYLDFGATYDIDDLLKRTVVSAPQGDAPIPMPDTAGTPMLAMIYYTVDSTAVPQLVVFDTVRVSCPPFDPGGGDCSITFYLPGGGTLVPNFEPGAVLIGTEPDPGSPSEGYFETDQSRLRFYPGETSKTLGLMYLGYQPLSYSAVVNGSHVSVSPLSGLTPDELTITVNSNLPAGLYRDTVEVSGPQAFNLLKIPVVVQTGYLCGDADGNSLLSISDVVRLINYIFAGGPAPSPLAAGDGDCNGIVTISDAVYLINYIFVGGAPPCEACK